MKRLDRYLITELAGPSLFGLAAFALIFAATYILSISRLIADEHAPLWAAVAYFFWQLPQIVLVVIPMALLLGTLLTLQRLSGDSEIVAMKAGGISMERIVTPILVVGFVISLLTLLLQELLVPYAQERASMLLNDQIRHVGIAVRDLSVTIGLPGGGRQVTAATGYDAATGILENVTVIDYDHLDVPQEIIVSRRARFLTSHWTFADARSYHLSPDGSTVVSFEPSLIVDIGEDPNQLLQRASRNNPDELSRSQLSGILRSPGLTEAQIRTYRSAYDAKLAQPFACFVFTVIAIPFGLRRLRGGGTSVGFGLAVAIVFVYYVIMTICRGVATTWPESSILVAWLPNVLFTSVGLLLLRRVRHI